MFRRVAVLVIALLLSTPQFALAQETASPVAGASPAASLDGCPYQPIGRGVLVELAPEFIGQVDQYKDLRGTAVEDSGVIEAVTSAIAGALACANAGGTDPFFFLGAFTNRGLTNMLGLDDTVTPEEVNEWLGEIQELSAAPELTLLEVLNIVQLEALPNDDPAQVRYGALFRTNDPEYPLTEPENLQEKTSFVILVDENGDGVLKIDDLIDDPMNVHMTIPAEASPSAAGIRALEFIGCSNRCKCTSTSTKCGIADAWEEAVWTDYTEHVQEEHCVTDYTHEASETAVSRTCEFPPPN
jgi:hypothetical protein